MADKIVRNNFHQLLEEIRRTEGLPENLSTEAQLWDEALKKEAFVMPEQIFPLIEEIHGKHYEKGTSIKPMATEFSVERGDTGEISSIRADITLLVDDKDIYHFEAEIENDGTMVLRMFEYDVHFALSYPKQISPNSAEESKIALTFPHSAVLYLQDNRNTPDHLECQIQFQDGGTYTYRVPVLKVQSYSLEAIEKKHLSILVPFLPLRFRKNLVKDKDSGKISFKLSKEELTSFYQDLILILDREVASRQLTEKNRSILLSLLRKSMIRVFHQDASLIKEVVEMTEPILELEIEQYIRASEEAERRAEEKVQEKLEEIAEKKAQEKIQKVAQDLTQELTQKFAQELTKYKEESARDKELIASLQHQLAAMQKG